MTLQRMSTGTYEQHDFLTAEHVAKCAKYTIKSEPRIVKVSKWNPEKPQEKCFIDVTPENDSTVLTYVANKTSFNKLFDMFGQDEKNWIGKSIELESPEQIVNGKKKRVLYIKGSI